MKRNENFRKRNEKEIIKGIHSRYDVSTLGVLRVFYEQLCLG